MHVERLPRQSRITTPTARIWPILRQSVIVSWLLVNLIGRIAQSQVQPSPTFDVASIHQSKADGWSLRFTVDGLIGKGVSLRYLLQEAFGVYNEQLWSNVPAWTAERKFDIEAKFEPAEHRALTLTDRREMLQNLLQSRFKLVTRFEIRDFPAYALVIAKGGPKLRPSNQVTNTIDASYGPMCMHTQKALGYYEEHNCSMKDLALELTGYADVNRAVIDDTGLNGRYDFELRWRSDMRNESANGDSAYPNLFVALREQLGLQLKPVTVPLQRIVVDHIEMPSEN